MRLLLLVGCTALRSVRQAPSSRSGRALHAWPPGDEGTEPEPCAHVWASHSLGDFVVQRSIQTQLSYYASLRNEPGGNWLASFQDQRHLDSTGRSIGLAGMPHTYSARLGAMTRNWVEYLTAMGDEPDATIEITLAAPPNRMSSHAKKNPFLQAAQLKSLVYQETVDTRAVLGRLLTTATAVTKAARFHLVLVYGSDLVRVTQDRDKTPKLPSDAQIRERDLMRGGETPYEEEPMPLAELDRRALDRYCTLRAYAYLLEELEYVDAAEGLPWYLAPPPESETSEPEAAQDARIVERRAQRRLRRGVELLTGDVAALAAAREFCSRFGDKWMPRLERGEDVSSLTLLGRSRPGGRRVKGGDQGSEADEVLEELWGHQPPWYISGGDLVYPPALGMRLRELRAEAAAEAIRQLDAINAVINDARAAYPERVQQLGANTRSLQNMVADNEPTAQ